MLAFYLMALDTEEEKSKFERIYHEYKGLMLKIAYDILKDYDLANDALHTAFLKIVNHINKFDEISCHKTKSYMVLVIESVAKNMYNKRKREKIISFDDISFEIADESFEEKMDTEIEVDEVAQIIKKLPEIYSTVLTLKFLHDLSNKQIAQILGISPAAARKRLERAKDALNTLLRR